MYYIGAITVIHKQEPCNEKLKLLWKCLYLFEENVCFGKAAELRVYTTYLLLCICCVS